MKRSALALLLALCLALSGCAAMLDREYALVRPHSQSLTAAEDPSALQASSYQELVSAVLYLVTQHTDSGAIRLYNYTGDVEEDLTTACLEVVHKDPLGAFAVDYIKHEVQRIVSYYEANVTITYRRTAEEVAAIQSVTGSSAIKSELRQTLSAFSPETLLRISYFADDEEYLHSLIAQAYYDTPAAAFGLPQVTLALYPETGIQRIVEIGLTYPGELETLTARSAALEEAADALLDQVEVRSPQALYDLLLAHVSVEEGPDLNTAYAALTQGRADGEGLALAYKLLCDRAGLTCTVVLGREIPVPAEAQLATDQPPEGEATPQPQPPQEERPRFWNIVSVPGEGFRHVDCAAGLFGLTDLQLAELGGYLWDNSYPGCREARTDP